MNEESYWQIPFDQFPVEDVAIGYQQIGEGDDLVFIHGFPTHGYTWRKLLPGLSKKFRCHIIDLPGLGNSSWSKKTDFKSGAMARYVITLLKEKNIEKYSLIAHDSGATVARDIAIKEQNKVKNLFLLNTEIPNHRPPWIPFYQQVGLWKVTQVAIKFLLKKKWFVKSSMGFKEFYTDKTLLDDPEMISPYLEPVISSNEKMSGAFKYLKGIDWQLIDEFQYLHKEITANTLFLWGADDRTFPIHLGREMTKQFTCKTEFHTIQNASLLPHEEKPDEVVGAILKFIE